jgi:hypothetical protein
MKSRLPLLALAFSLSLAFGAQAQPQPGAPAAPAAASDAVISNPDYEKAGQTAAHAWLLLLDRRDWGTAWDASAGMFRQSVPLGVWMDNVPRLREPFGAFVERQPAESLYKKSLPGRADGDYVTSHFVSKFDRKAEVIETVTTVREPDGRWRVTGYTAR